MKTLNKELQAEAKEMIEKGCRVIVLQKNSVFKVFDGRSTDAVFAKRNGWKYVGETFDGEHFFKRG